MLMRALVVLRTLYTTGASQTLGIKQKISGREPLPHDSYRLN